MIPMRIVLFVAVYAAGSAQAQLLAPTGDVALKAAPRTALPLIRSSPYLDNDSSGLPPGDPQAVYLYRADPKLSASIQFTPAFAVESTLTNPNYSPAPRYVGSGPRLAQGAPLLVGGYDVETAGRLAIPVNDDLSTYGKLGIASSVRQHWQGRTTDVGAAASVGASLKLNQGQTATLEIPISTVSRKTFGGTDGSYGARLRLGF